MTELEVDAQDVVRLMLQFCKENGLKESLKTLQQESQVALNTVESVEVFLTDVQTGNWDAVLQACQSLQLPVGKLMAVHEQIILELLELREVDVARAMLRQTEAMQAMKQEQPERYMRLESLCSRPIWDAREAYEAGNSKETRRVEIAKSLSTEVTVVPPSRLLVLIGQALKWQQHQGMLPPGTQFDVFRGTAAAKPDENDEFPTKSTHQIKFGKKSHAECAAFSPDGQYLVSGSIDGFVEVWDHETGKLRKDLKYQANEDLMMHEEAVLSLAWSKDSELLATADQGGKIKVWKVRTGQCARRFDKAHSQGITCLCFSRDSTQICSASYDATMRMHGLKSGKMLKEMRGHSSYINHCSYTTDGLRLVSAGSDGWVKVWDPKTAENLHSFRPNPAGAEIPVNCVCMLPKSDHILVCDRSSTAYVMTIQGQVVKTISSGKKTGGDFLSACVSRMGTWLYCIAEDQTMYVFSIRDSKLEHLVRIHDKEPIGLCQHPHRNLVATYADDCSLKLWRS
mmetsp:Transcript_43658/g.103171  ORF Transcript_43658/g.103171 Transcript_43658/m.103171 type:complete len:512 (-) Transcript_43658:857-2392(-)